MKTEKHIIEIKEGDTFTVRRVIDQVEHTFRHLITENNKEFSNYNIKADCKYVITVSVERG